MSLTPAGDAPACQDTPSTFLRFVHLPAELRVMVYDFHFYDMIATIPETSLTIEYHFCDKRYEVTTDLDRFRAHNRTGRFLNLVCVGPLLRQEAEPMLYDYFEFIVTLRQHWTPLDLSEGDRYMLSHASRLQIHLPNDRVCQSIPPHHRIDDHSLCRKVRRGSWDAGSSLTSSVVATREQARIARPRSGSWSGPAQRTPYIDRLDALFDALGPAINLHLKSLDIFISGIRVGHRRDDGTIARQLDRRTLEKMLRHIGARVRLKPDSCVASLHLDRRIGNLLPRPLIVTFLSEIQYRSTYRRDFSGVIPSVVRHILDWAGPCRVAGHRSGLYYLLRSALLYRPESPNFQLTRQIKDIFGPRPHGLNGLFLHGERSIPECEWWTFRLQPRWWIITRR